VENQSDGMWRSTETVEGSKTPGENDGLSSVAALVENAAHRLCRREFIEPAVIPLAEEREGGGVSNPVSSLSPSFFSSYLQSSSSRSPVHSQPKGTDTVHRLQTTTFPLHHAPRRLYIRPESWFLSSPIRLQSRRLLRLRPPRPLSKPASNSFLSRFSLHHPLRTRIRRKHLCRRRRPTRLQSY